MRSSIEVLLGKVFIRSTKGKHQFLNKKDLSDQSLPSNKQLIESEKPMDDENDHSSIDIPEPVERMADEKDQVQVSIHIMKKLDLVKPVSKRPSDPYIGIVPKHLRDVNERAYEPQIIAIGPYHRRNKPHLDSMEEHKLRYLKMLLQRTGEDNVKRYVKTMGKLEEKARACYADPICLSGNEFVEMLLLDACFIVELFRKHWPKRFDMGSTTTYNDPIFDSCWIKLKLCRDLLLVENQIPFFVLHAFFKKTATPEEETDFLRMIFSFFVSLLPNQCYKKDADDHFKISKIKHLLSFVHDRWVYGVALVSPISGTRKWKIFEIFCLWRKKEGLDKAEQVHHRCATKLKEAGIKFKMVYGKSLFDIKFENGTMKVPRLTIEDDTESFLRNLIAYEQLYPEKSNLVVDYMNFMDCLINSEKDVELLCRRKIVDNCLGDDEIVAKIFNRLGDSVMLSSSDHYTKIYAKLNKHCRRSRNKWMANLRHNYFNTPWALISFLAAVLLLLFTFTQTVFSVLAYYK